MRISDWSSDVCSSDLAEKGKGQGDAAQREGHGESQQQHAADGREHDEGENLPKQRRIHFLDRSRLFFLRLELRMPHQNQIAPPGERQPLEADQRSEEHTSELQSLMRISYAVFCLKKK